MHKVNCFFRKMIEPSSSDSSHKGTAFLLLFPQIKLQILIVRIKQSNDRRSREFRPETRLIVHIRPYLRLLIHHTPSKRTVIILGHFLLLFWHLRVLLPFIHIILPAQLMVESIGPYQSVDFFVMVNGTFFEMVEVLFWEAFRHDSDDDFINLFVEFSLVLEDFELLLLHQE